MISTRMISQLIILIRGFKHYLGKAAQMTSTISADSSRSRDRSTCVIHGSSIFESQQYKTFDLQDIQVIEYEKLEQGNYVLGTPKIGLTGQIRLHSHMDLQSTSQG